MRKWTQITGGLALATAVALALPAQSQDAANQTQDTQALVEEMVEHGEQLFFEGKIGVGCAACHGDDARGLIGQDIRGKSIAEIIAAANSVEDMQNADIDKFTEDEFVAIHHYLAKLATMPAAEN
jgi:mono/diheme cytochrome c family protein